MLPKIQIGEALWKFYKEVKDDSEKCEEMVQLFQLKRKQNYFIFIFFLFEIEIIAICIKKVKVKKLKVEWIINIIEL